MVPFDFPLRTQDMLHRFIGIDYTEVGHVPGDSYIDGEDKPLDQAPPQDPTPPTPPKPPTKPDEPAPPPTHTSEAEQAAADAAAWLAYRRSGEAALVVVVIAATIWGIFIWRSRRRRAKGYLGVRSEEPYDDRGGDVEAAREFDESELDDLGPGGKGRYALEDDDEDEEDGERRDGRTNGHVT
jgi:carboxypeptidase D